MVTRQQFMSIGLKQCGADPATFSQLSDVWNREKEVIQNMDKQEVRNNLVCP